MQRPELYQAFFTNNSHFGIVTGVFIGSLVAEAQMVEDVSEQHVVILVIGTSRRLVETIEAVKLAAG